jgi:hypothetical protein
MKATVYARRFVSAVQDEDSSPDVLLLERRADGQLWAERRGVARPVWVSRCFPWSEPTRFISLRDDRKREFALVRDLTDLDLASRVVLEVALVEAGFVLDVLRVLDIDEEVEIRNWKVETVHGSRTFQTRLDDWPRQVPGGGLLVRDVAGDLYYIADPSSLDKTSRGLLWAFVDE